ncbi:MAG TPA: hypothetical protein VMU94_29025 [Streptosporangiaceae bacterium]|nr:hypothetical protein [Streptosporangiaceae bacterium]
MTAPDIADAGVPATLPGVRASSLLRRALRLGDGIARTAAGIDRARGEE